MARAKRLYFCELIPLWELDSDHLEVDWTQEQAKNGEIVEMRVVVKDLDLNMKTPDFTVEFEIAESDYFFFGGWDDPELTFTSKTDKTKEHRALAILAPNAKPPANERLTKIFVSPLPTAPQKLIQAFWAARWDGDFVGDPEYFFDVRLDFKGKEFEERSDHELSVSNENFGQASGTPGTGGTASGALVLPAVGWSAKESFAEKTVNQLALLDQANSGKPASFLITPDANASLLWILLIPRSNDAPGSGVLIRKAWTVPRFLPLENIKTLDLKATINAKEVKAATVDKAAAETFPGQTGGLFAQLTLKEGRERSTPPDPGFSVAEQQQRANALLASNALKQTVDQELTAWAAANGKSLSQTDSQLANTLQEFSFTLTHLADASSIKPRPTSGTALSKWTKNFQKSFVLGLMIMSAGSSADNREVTAGHIADGLAQAGFVTDALTLANLFSTRERQETTYETILKGARPTATQWTTVMNFFTAGTGSLRDAEVHEAFGFLNSTSGDRLVPSHTRAFIAKLGTNETERLPKLEAITTALINAYANDPDLIWVLSGFLFLHPPLRQPFSDKLRANNQDYLLLKILMCPDFIEPGYAGQLSHDSVSLTMGRDMTWVYQNKQRIGVDFLVRLCDFAGTPIPGPANLSFNSLRAWLEAQTDTIAAAGVKVYPENKDLWFALYNLVTDTFFFHVDRFDIRPDLHGHIGALVSDAPNNLRLRADCDVFATYGARFLRAMGFTSTGYMGIMPLTATGGFGIGHAGALLKKDGEFFAINNKRAKPLAAATEAEAQRKLRDELFTVYTTRPTRYLLYFAAPDSTGGMLIGIPEQDEALRRRDLEP